MLVEDVAENLRRFVERRRAQLGRKELMAVTTRPQPMQRSLPLVPTPQPVPSCGSECEAAAAE